MPRKTTWFFINGILLAGIVGLLLRWAVVSWQRLEIRLSGEDRETPRFDDVSDSNPAHRAVDAGWVGVHPISFGDQVRSAELPERWTRRGAQAREWDWLPAFPGMDMTETPRDYVLMFSLPGVRDADICMGITGRVVTVQAAIRNADGNRVSALRRRVQLPEDPGSAGIVSAAFSNGILRVCVRK